MTLRDRKYLVKVLNLFLNYHPVILKSEIFKPEREFTITEVDDTWIILWTHSNEVQYPYLRSHNHQIQVVMKLDIFLQKFIQFREANDECLYTLLMDPFNDFNIDGIIK